MIHGPRHDRAPRHRPAVAAALLVLWLAAGHIPEATASQVASAAKSRGGHRCACGMDCGPVCCCKHKKADEPTPARPQPPTKVALRTGPCVGPAPCGAALPPGVSAVARVGEPADRAGVVCLMLDPASDLLVPPASDRPRGWLGSPPDEPPERPDDA